MKNILKKRRNRYLFAFLGMIILLLIPTIKPLFIITFGEEVHLRVEGYDPTDPFKGDFVRLGYETDFIPKELLSSEIISMNQDDYYRTLDDNRLYIELVRDGDLYVVKQVTLDKPDGLFIRANYSWSQFDYENNNELIGITVSLSMDRFYVPEGTGKAYEDMINNGEAYSVIKIINGYGVLTDLRTN